MHSCRVGCHGCPEFCKAHYKLLDIAEQLLHCSMLHSPLTAVDTAKAHGNVSLAAADSMRILTCRTSSNTLAQLQACALTGDPSLLQLMLLVRTGTIEGITCAADLPCRQAVNIQITQHGTAYNYNLYAVQVGAETVASVRIPTGKPYCAGTALPALQCMHT